MSVQHIEFIDLIDQVRQAMGREIPIDTSAPKWIMVDIPMWFRRGVTRSRRRNYGHWVSFTVNEEKKWEPGFKAVYFFSVDADFAISVIGPDEKHWALEPLSILSVLHEEELWRTGLTSLLEKANAS